MLLHALLDLIVDRYLVLADHLEDDTDEMEELVVNDPDSINASEIHRNKRNIQDLRSPHCRYEISSACSQEAANR